MSGSASENTLLLYGAVTLGIFYFLLNFAKTVCEPLFKNRFDYAVLYTLAIFLPAGFLVLVAHGHNIFYISSVVISAFFAFITAAAGITCGYFAFDYGSCKKSGQSSAESEKRGACDSVLCAQRFTVACVVLLFTCVLFILTAVYIPNYSETASILRLEREMHERRSIEKKELFRTFLDAVLVSVSETCNSSSDICANQLVEKFVGLVQRDSVDSTSNMSKSIPSVVYPSSISYVVSRIKDNLASFLMDKCEDKDFKDCIAPFVSKLLVSMELRVNVSSSRIVVSPSDLQSKLVSRIPQELKEYCSGVGLARCSSVLFEKILCLVDVDDPHVHR